MESGRSVRPLFSYRGIRGLVVPAQQVSQCSCRLVMAASIPEVAKLSFEFGLLPVGVVLLLDRINQLFRGPGNEAVRSVYLIGPVYESG